MRFNFYNVQKELPDDVTSLSSHQEVSTMALAISLYFLDQFNSIY
jgi:hypothetical protein